VFRGVNNAAAASRYLTRYRTKDLSDTRYNRPRLRVAEVHPEALVGWIYLVTIAVIATAIAAFALQNPGLVSIRFLVWSIDSVPLAAVILVSGAVGTVLVSVIALIQRWVMQSRIRRLESRLRLAEQSPKPQPRDVSGSQVQRDRPGPPESRT